MEKYYQQFTGCLQHEKPYCTDSCPFHLNILDFQDKMKSGRYNGAYKAFRNAVGFPEIVAELCPQYCGEHCPVNDSIQVNLLERTCVARATKKDPNDYNLPAKKGNIAIIGGGISGLACALRLASKKYKVTIYEKTNHIGGQLWDLMDSEVFLADIERQFHFEEYELNLNTEISQITVLSGYDAIYIATGKGGNDFGVTDCDLQGSTALFAGGSLKGKDLINSISDGLSMAWSIEIYLKTQKLEYPQPAPPTKVTHDPDDLRDQKPAMKPTDNGIFTDEEIAAETDRCIRCQCNACKKQFDLCAYTGKWPLEMRDDIMTTTMSSESMIHKTPAIRLINSYTQDDLLDEVCPGGVKLGEMLKQARRYLHRQDKMPPAFHGFWLNDMAFANGAYAAICKNAPGQEKSKYAFFPGCHLGAADPAYVKEPYKWLLSKQPDTGLLLRCCNVPADWAGNEELHHRQLSALRDDWNALGQPTLIMACPSCMKHFREYLQEIPLVSLYEILEQWGFEKKAPQPSRWSMFDPCSARNVQPLQNAVRNLAKNAEIPFTELPKGDKHGCCGFGGHVDIADPEFAKYVTDKSGGLSDNPYITYCINCRNVFQDNEKAAAHILDFLFDIKAGRPTVTQRRNNRVALKEMLLKEIWEEEMKEKPESCSLKLSISPEVQGKMDYLKLLEEDVCSVVEFGLKTGRRTLNPQTGTYKCYRELGHITCWVEYRVEVDVYEIINVYTHRMKIEMEGVWNGRKTDTDLR